MDAIEQLRERISSLQACTKIEVIQKGFSEDIKYVVHFIDGKKYLLRTAAIELYPRKKEEFNILRNLQKFDAQTPNPIEIGEIPDLGLCYYLLSYIEGGDARDLLPSYSSSIQYEIGFRAGKDLKKINAIQASSSIDSWYERKMKKFKNYFDAYRSCGIKINSDNKVIEFIEKNERSLINRPNHFLHDDFHVGNLIVKDAQYAGVIDFNRFDWGDPYLEFLKVGLFSREVSIPFSIGQIHGYFNNEIPNNFWLLYSVYLGMELFSAIVWTKKVVPEKLDEMIERIEQIVEDHKGFELTKPIWFKN